MHEQALSHEFGVPVTAKSRLMLRVLGGSVSLSKRSKVKKLLSPTRAVTPPPAEPPLDDDALMDEYVQL